MLMWLMSEAKGVERSLEGLARRLLLVNFAAIHPTSFASDDIQFPHIMQSYSLQDNRRSCKYCTVFLRILNISNLSVKRSTR